MSFPWLTVSSPGSAASAERRLAATLHDLRERAALMARLGYRRDQCSARLQARVAWDLDGARGPRPDALSDAAITQLVADAYQRHAPR